MKSTAHTLLAVLFLLCASNVSAQILLSEIAPTNPNALADEDGDFPGWLEIYNLGASTVSLEGYSLADGASPKWTLPTVTLGSNERILVFASGKDRGGLPIAGSINHWETALYEEDNWRYWSNGSSLPADWNQPGASETGWQSGPGGFGYGDGDDNTTVQAGAISFYYRQKFNVTDVSQIAKAILSMDYDDGFVAWFNGTEIARSNSMPAGTPTPTTPSNDHEAVMYLTGEPESFPIDSALFASLLLPGENVLAIEIHNVNNSSSDMSGRTWLHVGIKSTTQFFGANPLWFNASTGGNGSQLHTNFKLKFSENVRLFNPNGLLLDSTSIPYLEPGHAKMRNSDQGSWCLTDSPTPNAPNGNICSAGYSTAPTFSLPAGFYVSNQTVSIGGTSVRYTTDGSLPDASSPLFTQAITLNATTVLRARSFEPGKLPSHAVTATYFINEPTELPVLSITARPGDLFNDGSGGPAVYDNYGAGQSAACNLQYFDKNHALAFTENASLRPVGNYSVAFDQKGLQFIFEDDFGAMGEVDYPIFSQDKPGIQRYKGFRIRNTDDDASSTRIRDLVANRITLPTHCAAAGCQSMAVFINGEYWGHYEGRELLNEYFARDNFGDDPDRVDMLKTAYGESNPYLAEEGADTAFFAMSDFILNNDMSDPANFAQAQSLVDLENWVDYFASEIYNANVDWYSSVYFNNLRIFRGNHSDAFRKRWRFVLWDMGSTQGVYNGVGYDMLNEALADPAYPNRWTDMMNQLLENPEFKRYFINRFADLLNEYWTPLKTQTVVQAAAEELESEIPHQSQRWGTAGLASWLNGVQYLKEYHAEKPAVQRNQIEDFFSMNDQVNVTLQVQPPGAGWVKISTITPQNLPWTGVYFHGNPVTVTAIPALGYQFVNWSNNPFIGDLNSNSFTADISSNTSFTANFTGSAEPLDLQVAEVNYHSDPSRDAEDWVELKNGSTAPFDLSDFTVGDGAWYHRFSLPVGTVLPPGGRLVVYENEEKFAQQHPSVTNAIGELGFELGDDGDEVRLFDRFGGPVNAVVFDDARPWPCTPDGFGRSLEHVDNTDPSLPENWFDGCIGGSPGEAFSACDENPIVSEINYKSATAFDAGDWIELHNKSASAIDLSGWEIRDGGNANSFIIPAGTSLQAGSYLVFYEDGAKFSSLFPQVANKLGPLGFGLSADGDFIRLYDAQGRVQMSLCYDDAAPWDEDADGHGYTLENKDFDGNQNSPSNWLSSCYGGSPGTAFDPDCLSAVNENAESVGFFAFPNPANEVLFVRLESGMDGKVRLINMLGMVVLERSFNGTTELPISALATGVYTVSVVSEGGELLGTQLVVKQ